ncbi:MAG: hypothetical protein M1460_03455 [Candidatus Thermoplasmatota archaeon]|nr:hypothetical protein [Candidatus Thermoplasmatota archaeon]
MDKGYWIRIRITPKKGITTPLENIQSPGTDAITELIDLTVRIAIADGLLQHPMNVAIDDEPYCGRDNWYLINAPFHNFRGTDRAYRFASLEAEPDS